MTGAEIDLEQAKTPQVLCLIPPELSGKLLEPLRRHYREAGVEIEVLEERRSRERRSGKERRKKDKGPPRGEGERRRIHNKDGRRVGERRATLVPIDQPAALPRKARSHADRIVFCERIPIPAEQREDLDIARLVTRIQANGQEEFAELYRRFFDRVYAYLRVLLRDSHEAEDASQQVFVKVLEALPDYERREQPFRAWVFRIARNHAINELRRLKRAEPEDPAEIERLREHPVDDSAGEATLNWVTDSDLVLLIERLPAMQREILTLRYVIGLSTKEIGDALDRSPEAIRRAQSRAMLFLRERLAAVGRHSSRGRRAPSLLYRRQARVVRARRFTLVFNGPLG